MLFRDPLNRNRYLRCDEHDKSDVIVENNLSQKRQFIDMEKTDQLTQFGTKSTILFSPYTREDAYRDVTVINPFPIGRMEKEVTPNQPSKYHFHL